MDKFENEFLFLNKMCNSALGCGFAESALFFYLPCVVVNNQYKHVFNNVKELERWLRAYYQNLNVAHSNDIDNQLKIIVVVLDDI